MSPLDADLQSDLERYLTKEELNGFEAGELALYIQEPKEAFFHVSDGDLYRADVVRDVSPEGDADKLVTHIINQTNVDDFQRALRRQNELKTCPAQLIFGS